MVAGCVTACIAAYANTHVVKGKLVYPWESVSEIQSIKETHMLSRANCKQRDRKIASSHTRLYGGGDQGPTSTHEIHTVAVNIVQQPLRLCTCSLTLSCGGRLVTTALKAVAEDPDAICVTSLTATSARAGEADTRGAISEMSTDSSTAISLCSSSLFCSLLTRLMAVRSSLIASATTCITI